MRPGRAVAACAVGLLAAVFSVQQGEHGPLVVYKLQLDAGAAQPVPAAPPAEPLLVIPSRAPRVLGTVVMPAGGAAYTPPVPSTSTIEMATPAAVAASSQAAAGAVILEAVTLEDVSNDLTWRRETADKLPEVPFAPRF